MHAGKRKFLQIIHGRCCWWSSFQGGIDGMHLNCRFHETWIKQIFQKKFLDTIFKTINFSGHLTAQNGSLASESVECYLMILLYSGFRSPRKKYHFSIALFIILCYIMSLSQSSSARLILYYNNLYKSFLLPAMQCNSSFIKLYSLNRYGQPPPTCISITVSCRYVIPQSHVSIRLFNWTSEAIPVTK